jgi:hypothetical protein
MGRPGDTPVAVALVISSALALLGLAGSRPAHAVTTVGNAVYQVNVADALNSGVGQWNAVTGPGHPAGANRDLMYRRMAVWTNFSTIRIFGSSDLAPAGRGGAMNLDPSFVAEGPSPLGAVGSSWRTTWSASMVGIVQDLVVVGNTITDSAIYHSIQVTNGTGTPIQIGLRNLHDWSLNDPIANDGPGAQLEQLGGTVILPLTTNEFLHAPVTADVARISMASGTPTYQPLLGLAYDPGLHPGLPTTTPDAFAFVRWSPAYSTSFDYTTTGAAASDSASLSWFGRTSATAVTLLPGGSARFTQVVLAVLPGAQPNSDVVCPTGGATIDFESLEHVDANTDSHGLQYFEGGYRISELAGTLFTYGTQHPEFSGSTAMFSNHQTTLVTLGANFDLCYMELSEINSGAPPASPQFNGVGPGGSVTQTVVMDGVAPGSPQAARFSGFTNLQFVRWPALPLNLVQFDNICLCPTGTCACAPPVQVFGDSYCVLGNSNGAGWSWQLDAQTPVDVPGLPFGAGPPAIAAAFIASVNGSGIGATAAVDPFLGPSCFRVTYQLNSVLRVGGAGQAPNCLVTVSPSGCTFNPTLLDAKFAPAGAPVPSSGPGGRGLLAALLLIAGLCAATWFRRR